MAVTEIIGHLKEVVVLDSSAFFDEAAVVHAVLDEVVPQGVQAAVVEAACGAGEGLGDDVALVSIRQSLCVEVAIDVLALHNFT